MLSTLSSTETIYLSVGSLASIAVLINAWRENGEALYSSLAISGLAFTISFALIRWTGSSFVAKGFKGRDMGKKNPIEL